MAAREIDLDDDMAYQRRAWFAQRVAWTILGLIVVGALLGLFGSGPLGRSTASAGILSIEHDRFARYEDATTLTIRVDGRATAPDGLVRLSVNRAFLERARIESIVPAPERVEARDDGVAFGFRTGGAGPVAVDFTLRPGRPGRAEGLVRLESGGGARPAVSFRQLVLP